MSKFVRGGMIGAIIGGILAGVGLAWLVLFCIRRRLQQQQSQPNIGAIESGNKGRHTRKSMLRSRSRMSIFKLKKSRRDTKEVTFADAKTMSDSASDSETSIITNVAITIGSKNVELKQAGIELDCIKSEEVATEFPHIGGQSPVSPLTPEFKPSTQSQTEAPSNKSLYLSSSTSSYLTEPVPTPLTATTPGTANPLLGSFRNEFAAFDDNDDSDLYPQSKQQRKDRVDNVSDHLRTKMGLKIRTASLQPQEPSNADAQTASSNISEASKTLPRPRKPAHLPLKIHSASSASVGAGSQNMSPTSMKSMDSAHTRRHSLLRKVFPAH